MADNTFMLEVITPENILYKDEIQFLVAPGDEGELGVLKSHAPIVASLKIGVLKYKDPGGTQKKMAMSGGFLEVIDNTARVLAETAELAGDIDVMRANEAKQRAEMRLSQQQADVNMVRAELALQRAIARIKAAGQ